MAVGLLIFVALLVVGVCLSAQANRGKPLSEFGRATRHGGPSAQDALERQDLQEMLEATNARRRVRGLPERSVADAIQEFEID